MVGKNANEESILTGRTYMSRLKMCLDGPCQASGVNRSVVDQTVPKKNRTILGIVDGTILQSAEEAMVASIGWLVDKAKVVQPQSLTDVMLKHEGIIRKRGQPPRDDRKGDTESELEKEREKREKKERREQEKDEREREWANNLRPAIRRVSRKVKKVGRVIEAMSKALRLGIDSKVKVKVGEKVEGQMWTFVVEARGGGYHAVKISQKPECTCWDY